MAGFNFERDLKHQKLAVESVVSVFDGVDIIAPTGSMSRFRNPILNCEVLNKAYRENISALYSQYGEGYKKPTYSKVIDIMMETGTGKTYTYAKTMFELNRLYGIFKFVIVVPTLSIKAGTIDFLSSKSSREHFWEQYGKSLNLHIVESKKSGKSKKEMIPQAVSNFVNAGNFATKQIQVLVINAGMLNSDTMNKSFDRSIFDTYSVPFEAIADLGVAMIVDEPHKFTQGNKTWENMQKMKPQFILRYGATFLKQEIENLVYSLTALDAFNQNLVKGVIGHITEFENGKNVALKLMSLDGTEARFELAEGDKVKKKSFSLLAKESLAKIHPAMQDLSISKMNRSVVVLSNGLELKRGDIINPFSYAQTLQESMINKAIKEHFELERSLLTREVKIKPLTLFFIDNIEEYRGKDGYTRRILEQCIEAQVRALLESETDEFYRGYLELTLRDLASTHGGYFAKDNATNDELIEKELEEILHDKQTMLSLKNPRRFIFSKWTLREGWDNPNVFQICKLRSSGSEISKLQEVGRGLRLPVNQYGNRVKDEQFFLNYFVDFTESDFVDKLVNEINEKSGAIILDASQTKLSEAMIQAILAKYPKYDNEALLLLEELDEAGVIKRNNDFKEGGLEYMKQNFAPVFGQGIGTSKIRNSNDKKQKVAIRVEKYAELKDLWEKLNQKVILQYNIKSESEFERIFGQFLVKNYAKFINNNVINATKKLYIDNEVARVYDESSVYNKVNTGIKIMSYADFLQKLAVELNMNIKTLHRVLLASGLDFNSWLNMATIRIIKDEFDKYLLYNALNTFGIEYQKVTNTVHPTKFTDDKGMVKKEVLASEVGGVLDESLEVDPNFMLEYLFYDSELEKENMLEHIKDVMVFTKIPKNSIKIPVAGGGSYSPDFAYVFNLQNGKKKLYFIVETKNADEYGLRDTEKQRIRHAEKFFGDTIKIEFKTQFQNKKITDLIREIIA
jgi:type III restriction enzyme